MTKKYQQKTPLKYSYKFSVEAPSSLKKSINYLGGGVFEIGTKQVKKSGDVLTTEQISKKKLEVTLKKSSFEKIFNCHKKKYILDSPSWLIKMQKKHECLHFSKKWE